jgi:nitrite reductase/ring-hydroxylating ferredoxin subunit
MAGLTPGSRLCDSGALVDGGVGVRFTVLWQGQKQPAFAIRYRGRVHAYLNRCGHLAVELDWEPGQFFDHAGNALVCATHGASYDPGTGACTGGRCQGVGLVPLSVAESDGTVHLAPENALHLIQVEPVGKADD